LNVTHTHQSVPASIAGQVAGACTLLSYHLGDTLRAIHLFGSAADGGLKPCSDIDLLVTTNSPLSTGVRRALMQDLLTISAWPATHDIIRALEITIVVHDAVVPWQYPAWRELQFGEWLRTELESGHHQQACVDHDLAILLTQARQHSVCLAGPPAAALFDPIPEADLRRAYSDTLAQWNEAADWQGEERNIVLALARIWFSISTNTIAPKHIAAQWALERLPPEHEPVLATALASYLGQAKDDLADRSVQMARFVHYVKSVIEQSQPY